MTAFAARAPQRVAPVTGRDDAGFTLVEALVAMAVLAVAAGGFIRATAGHVDAIAALETRAAGGWAADNALTEARLRLPPAATPLLGRTWRTEVATRATDDAAVAALTVTAEAAGTRVALRGFRDAAAAAPATGPAAGAPTPRAETAPPDPPLAAGPPQ